MSVRIFVGKMFKRWAGSEAISDEDLFAAAKEAFAVSVEGDLGGYVFKKRIARTGSGNSGNITRQKKDALSINAKAFIETSDEQIDALKNKSTILELECKE
jgi:hypothetical protein